MIASSLLLLANALGIVAREMDIEYSEIDRQDLSEYFLSGGDSLNSKGLLAQLRFDALEMIKVDSPKIPRTRGRPKEVARRELMDFAIPADLQA